MNVPNLPEDGYLSSTPLEVEELKAQLETLEQLLEVYERETVEKSKKLEQTLADLHDHTQRLALAESTLTTLRSMLNSMGEPVVVVDLHGKFLFLNSPAETLLGISPTCSSLRCWAATWNVYLSDQMTPYPLASFPLVQAMQGDAVDATELFVHSAHAVQGYWFSVTVRSLCAADGAIQGGIAVFHNITNLKLTELALRQSEAISREQAQQLQQALCDLQKAQAQLIQTEKMSSLGQLVAGVAHEINNPVNFIYGNLSPARNYVNDLLSLVQLYQTHHHPPHSAIQEHVESVDLNFVMGDLPKLLSSIEVGAVRIRDIVASLRTFSRIDEAEIKAVDLHEGIESTLLILQNQFKARSNGTEIRVVRQYGEVPLVECYAGQLNQVFMNILSNAIDALEEVREGKYPEKKDACITIKTHLTCDRQVEISIHDNGSGIPEASKARLFDPFFTTKPIGKGTGMGLSISYQIVTEKHRGQLSYDSRLGEGTTFIITIPLNQS